MAQTRRTHTLLYIHVCVCDVYSYSSGEKDKCFLTLGQKNFRSTEKKFSPIAKILTLKSIYICMCI